MTEGAKPNSADIDNTSAQLGRTVRTTRTRLGLSVQALAERAGLSLGLVSQLERGMGNPSLHSIERIANALGIPLSRLLEPPAEVLSVVRAGQRHTLSSERDQASSDQPLREQLSPPGESRIQLIRTTLPAGFTNADHPFRHIGTESVTVMSGRLLLVHGDERATLEEGDSATYGCSTPHWWANASEAETIVLGAFSPIER